jgi:hypothetical protein
MLSKGANVSNLWFKLTGVEALSPTLPSVHANHYTKEVIWSKDSDVNFLNKLGVKRTNKQHEIYYTFGSNLYNADM